MAKFIKIGDKIIDVNRIKVIEPISDDLRKNYFVEEGMTHAASTETTLLWLTQAEFDEFARQVIVPAYFNPAHDCDYCGKFKPEDSVILCRKCYDDFSEPTKP